MELNKNQKRLSLGGARLLLYKRVFFIGGTATRIGQSAITGKVMSVIPIFTVCDPTPKKSSLHLESVLVQIY